jgi:prophage regulatory protein
MGNYYENRFLRLPEVKQRIQVSRATIYRLVESGQLARPHRLGSRCVGWLASDINDFILRAPVSDGHSV